MEASGFEWVFSFHICRHGKMSIVKYLRGKLLRRDNKYIEVQKGNWHREEGKGSCLGNQLVEIFSKKEYEVHFSVSKKILELRACIRKGQTNERMHSIRLWCRLEEVSKARSSHYWAWGSIMVIFDHSIEDKKLENQRV